MQARTDLDIPEELWSIFSYFATTKQLLNFRQVSKNIYHHASIELFKRNDKQSTQFIKKYLQQWPFSRPIVKLPASIIQNSLQRLDLNTTDRLNGLNAVTTLNAVAITISEDDFTILLDHLYAQSGQLLSQTAKCIQLLARYFTDHQRDRVLTTILAYSQTKNNIDEAAEALLNTLALFFTPEQQWILSINLRAMIANLLNSNVGSGYLLRLLTLLPSDPKFKRSSMITTLIFFGFNNRYIWIKETIEKSSNLIAFYTPFLNPDQRAMLASPKQALITTDSDLKALTGNWLDWIGPYNKLVTNYHNITQAQRDRVTEFTVETLSDTDRRAVIAALNNLPPQMPYLDSNQLEKLQDKISILINAAILNSNGVDLFVLLNYLRHIINFLDAEIQSILIKKALFLTHQSYYNIGEISYLCNTLSDIKKLITDKSQIEKLKDRTAKFTGLVQDDMIYLNICLCEIILAYLSTEECESLYEKLCNECNSHSISVSRACLNIIGELTNRVSKSSVEKLLLTLIDMVQQGDFQYTNSRSTELLTPQLDTLLIIWPYVNSDNQNRIFSLLNRLLSDGSATIIKPVTACLAKLSPYFTTDQMHKILLTLINTTYDPNQFTRSCVTDLFTYLIVQGKYSLDQLRHFRLNGDTNGILIHYTSVLITAINEKTHKNSREMKANCHLFFQSPQIEQQSLVTSRPTFS